MRQGQQHRRGRGRHNNNNNNQQRKGQNPLARSYESNGPDVKVRGTPAHVAEKYMSLARDALSAGDPVLAENYLQHAEHYNRIILAYREQQGMHGGDMNGGHRPRQDAMPTDGDEVAVNDDGEAAGDEFGQGDQPMITRFPQQEGHPQDGQMHQRQGDNGQRDRGGDDRGQRSFDQQGHQGQHPNQMRFRDRGDRGDRGDRPRHDRQHDRFQRHDRGERFDRGDRGDRVDRDNRMDRGDRFDRGDRGDRGGDRMERHGGDRDRDRDRDRGFDRRPRPDDRAERGNGNGEYRSESRLDVPRAERGDRERGERDRNEPRPVEQAVAPRERDSGAESAEPMTAEEAAPPPRTEGRRRERFAQGEQPEFLRRPLGRRRREAEAPAEGDAPSASSEEPTRE